MQSLFPCVQANFNGPHFFIEQQILKNQAKIECWFRKQWQNIDAPIYSSVDLRNSGFKLAPVDTNLFPAGFNNLHPQQIPLAVQAMQATLAHRFSGCTRILIIPESHTRNLFYLESVKTLQEILTMAGYDTRIGSLLETLNEPLTITLASGKSIQLEKLVRHQNRIGVADFDACVVLLNHDLSGGVPEILRGIEQKLIPPLKAGWSDRLKSHHFEIYSRVAKEFAELIELEPWALNPYFNVCDDLDFMEEKNVIELEAKAKDLFAKIEKRYQQWQIKLPPYIVVKADAGTYGMGVMTIKHPKELLELNRKERTRMATSKGGQKITRVILQEGVYTSETIGENQAVAEPVVYMIGQHVVGGFYRVHQERHFDENLNAPGMHFEPLSFDAPCNCPEFSGTPDCQQNRFYAYGVIARIAALAASYEML